MPPGQSRTTDVPVIIRASARRCILTDTTQQHSRTFLEKYSSHANSSGLLIIPTGGFDVGAAAAADPPAAALSVFGLNGAEIRITAAQWSALPRAALDVIDHGGSPAHFEGVAGREVLKLAGAPLDKDLRGANLAVFVVAEAADGYRVIYSLAEFDSGFKDATILVADKKDGKALAAEDGPLRIVVPGEKRQGRWTRQLVALKLGKAQ